MPDRILYERLQGEFGDKDLRIRTVCRDLKADFLAETQSIDRDIFPYVFYLCMDTYKFVRIRDAVPHQTGNRVNRGGDVVLPAHQGHVVDCIHGVEHEMRIHLGLQCAKFAYTALLCCLLDLTGEAVDTPDQISETGIQTPDFRRPRQS